MGRRPGSKNKNHAEKVEVAPLLIERFAAGKAIAEELVPKFHDELVTANIMYLCRDRAAKQGGNPVPGSAKKASLLERFLSRTYFTTASDKIEDPDSNVVPDVKEADFIITIALDLWNAAEASQRRAIMDHYLTRCTGEADEESGEMKFKLRAPNVQEFPEVAERNGTYNVGLEELSNGLKEGAR